MGGPYGDEMFACGVTYPGTETTPGVHKGNFKLQPPPYVSSYVT